MTLAASARLPAATFVVNSAADFDDANPGDGICETGPGNGVCTLRAAIEEAESLPGPDTIKFDASLPSPTTFLLSKGHLEITSDLTIIGRGSASTIIDGDGSATGDRVLLTEGTSAFAVSISGVTVQGGTSSSVGAIAVTRSDTTVHLFDVSVIQNTGGGILSSGTLTLDHCHVSGNSNLSYGGGISNYGTLTVIASVIQGNSSGGYGGGLSTQDLNAEATLIDCEVTLNSAAGGGGVYVSEGTADFVNSTVGENHATYDGGGIYVVFPGTVSLYNASVVRNSCAVGRTGGGIYGQLGVPVSITNTILAQTRNRTRRPPFRTTVTRWSLSTTT